MYTVYNVRIVSAFLRRDIYGRTVLSVGEFVMESGKLFTSRTPGQVRASVHKVPSFAAQFGRNPLERMVFVCCCLQKFRGAMLID